MIAEKIHETKGITGVVIKPQIPILTLCHKSLVMLCHFEMSQNRD